MKRIIMLHGDVSGDGKRLAVTAEQASKMLVEAQAAVQAFHVDVDPDDAANRCPYCGATAGACNPLTGEHVGRHE